MVAQELVQNVASAMDFDKITQSTSWVAVHFWAPWCIPCEQMDAVFAELAKQHPGATFVRVEAEEVSDLSERYDISMVPHFLVLKAGKKVAEVEGADAGALTSQVQHHLKSLRAAAPQTPAGSQASAVSTPTEPAAASTNARIKALLASADVLLCMKGTPDAPRCGFSAKVVAALRDIEVTFSTFDILTDERIRQALKEYSNWPTYPQLYVKGELLGGCDIILELHKSHELKDTITESMGSTQEDDDPQARLHSRLKQLVSSNDVMLFMKGTPEQPRCGFSSKVVAALKRTSLPFGAFDILQDEEVRQGLKEYSDWPTYPQLYAGGELVGGCDLIMELDQSGELKQTLQEELAG